MASHDSAHYNRALRHQATAAHQLFVATCATLLDHLHSGQLPPSGTIALLEHLRTLQIDAWQRLSDLEFRSRPWQNHPAVPPSTPAAPPTQTYSYIP